MNLINTCFFSLFIGFTAGRFFTESTDDLILKKQEVKAQLKKLTHEAKILERHVNKYVDISHCINKESK